METILFTFPNKAQAEAEEAARKYRILYRFSFVFSCVLAALIGILIAHIMTAPAKTVIITQTATATPSAEVTFEAVSVEPVYTAPPAFFALTTEQRTLIEQVVSAECRGEPYEGQIAVAQCILNACLKDGISPERAIEKYTYTSNREEPTDSVKEAVAAVFDRGETITDEPIVYFYAPDLVTSEWHESQVFVTEIGCHRFFKEAQGGQQDAE